jgi:hypothetical protein
MAERRFATEVVVAGDTSKMQVARAVRGLLAGLGEGIYGGLGGTTCPRVRITVVVEDEADAAERDI